VLAPDKWILAESAATKPAAVRRLRVRALDGALAHFPLPAAIVQRLATIGRPLRGDGKAARHDAVTDAAFSDASDSPLTCDFSQLRGGTRPIA
jgi:hypothetical protein